MVKRDFARALQLKENISFGEAEQLVNELFKIIKESLVNGEEVSIYGFGKSEIDARRVVTFAPSKVWRQELNGGEQ